MAQPFRDVGPGRLQIREGGGCLAVFGLPFVGAGVFLMLGALPLSNAGEMPGFAQPALLLMGLVFTGVGGTLVFGRSWTIVDAAERRVIRQWGLIVPMKAHSHALDDYSAVTLAFVEGDSDTADRFPVSLKARSGAPLPLCSFTEYADSRACAAAVARHLGFDVEDASTDHPTRLSPDEADLPLQRRMRTGRAREGRVDRVDRVDRPADARSAVSEENGRMRISIPPPRAHPVALVALLAPAAIAAVFVLPLSQFFRQTRTPDPVAYVFLGFLVLFFGLLPAAGAFNAWRRSRRGATIVTVWSEGMRVEERGAWRTRMVASLDGAEIMDVDYSTTASLAESAARAAQERVLASGQVPASSTAPALGPRTDRLLATLSRFAKGRGVTVKTRQGLTRFGQGLADDEIRYLHAVVRRALSGP